MPFGIRTPAGLLRNPTDNSIRRFGSEEEAERAADALRAASTAGASPVAEVERLRGFAAMDPAVARAAASRGGHAVQAAGKGHRFTREEAREAARKAVVLRARASTPQS